MDTQRIRERCSAIAELLRNTTQQQQSTSSSHSKSKQPHSSASTPLPPPPPQHLLQQSHTTPLTNDECAVLIDWIAQVMMSDSNESSNSSSAAAASAVSSASLPSYPLLTPILRYFRSLLPSLLSRILTPSNKMHFASQAAFLRAASNVAHIAMVCPLVLPTILEWFHRSPFPLPSLTSTSSSSATVVFTCLRLLHLDATSFRAMYDWSAFLSFTSVSSAESDAMTLWMAAQAMTIVLKMNEGDKEEYVRKTMKGVETSAAAQQRPEILYQQYLTSVKVEQSLAWIDGKECDAENDVASNTDDNEADEKRSNSTADLTATDSSLSSMMVSLGGVMLPKRSAAAISSSTSPTPLPSSTLVHVPSTNANLRAIGLGICENRPILLEGPSGSGKSLLIEECAHLTNNYSDLVRLHLDDQMDSKTLLGTYTCTDIPGEFKWIPGALTQAVMQGKWVLIEDIDRCPFEILSAILSLLERRELFLSGRNEILYAHPGFQLFATKTVTSQAANITTESTHLLNALFSRIYVHPLTYGELAMIVRKYLEQGSVEDKKQNHLNIPKKLVQQILNTFMLFVNLHGSSGDSSSSDASLSTSPQSPFSSISSRKYSTRDLLKWCARIRNILLSTGFNAQGTNEHLTNQMQEEIYLAAVEVFVAPIPSQIRIVAPADPVNTSSAAVASTISSLPTPSNPRTQILHHLSSLWSIDPQRREYYINSYKPRLDIEGGSMTLGRVTLMRSATGKKSDATIQSLMSSFAFTRYSLRLMENICMSVLLDEPILLVSDTGVGKTTTIQFLASLMGKKLYVQNLNQQSDSADLIGGYKPIEITKLFVPLMQSFGTLFPKTFSRQQNLDFLNKLHKAFTEKQWNVCVRLMKQTVESAEKKLVKQGAVKEENTTVTVVEEADSTKRKQAKLSAASSASSTASAAVVAPPSSSSTPSSLLSQWSLFSTSLTHFSHQLSQLSSNFVFHFNEGSLIQALKQGDWILLDELNLASNETLERINGILEAHGSLSITERGDTTAIVRHPDFRLFAAMNPATDAGKKSLPPSVRMRFTEMYVEEMTDKEDLSVIVKQYLEPSLQDSSSEPPLTDSVIPYAGIVSFYLQARAMSASGQIIEGSNNSPASSNTKPHYSLRTLCRALQYTRDVIRMYGLVFERALYEGFLMSFCTLLTPDSYKKLHELLIKLLGFDDRTKSQVLNVLLSKPASTHTLTYELIGGAFWIPRGPEMYPDSATAKFILTVSVKHRLRHLSRAMLTGKYPILLQGPTSGGKTSLVEYLAIQTGHKFVRINNHEHTDLQEYIGSYITDSVTGKLVFQEGILVEAVRKGYWIVLDELNLAPSEVLEALNRLLDDNRELYIPETQETLKPHPHFMLFATQNPSGGIYGGRKILSKAFRNRFITLHVDDLPDEEVEEILEKRCLLPQSYCKAMINVMKSLASRRESKNVFAGKRSFMTPRDLFRWGERSPASWQQLAEDGYMLLGERLRTDDAKLLVKQTLEKECKMIQVIDEERLYSQESVNGLIGELMKKMGVRDTAAKKDGEEGDEEMTSSDKSSSSSKKQKKKQAKLTASSSVSSSSTISTSSQPTVDSASLLDPTSSLYSSHAEASAIGKIAWTYNMRRLFIQVGRCLLYEEPVLLVGETGCGKTTVCQLFALVLNQLLRVINCHQHTESSDFLGGLRPVRGKDKTAAELKEKVREWMMVYREAQTAVASTSVGEEEKSSSVENAADTQMSDDAQTSFSSSSSFTLPPLSPESLTLLTSLESSSPVSTLLSIPDLLNAYTTLSQPILTLESRLATEKRVYDEKLREAAKQKEAERLEQQEKNKSGGSKKRKKAAAAAAATENDADVNMDDSATPAFVSSNPIPSPLWTSLLALTHSISTLSTRYQSLFEWVDGALVSSLRSGDLLLIDEISLADDAVLERLNSVLEPSRTLFLAEKGGRVPDVIKAHAHFRIFATMNPGGDFGKKELSPALRNRFTEIWVPPFSDKKDLMRIIQERMQWKELYPYAESVLEFVQWFNRNTGQNEKKLNATIAASATTADASMELPSSSALVLSSTPTKTTGAPPGSKRYLSLRDILGWVAFMNQCLKLHSSSSTTVAISSTSSPSQSQMSGFHAYLHGSALTVLDGLGIGSTDSDAQILQLKNLSIEKLMEVLPESDRAELDKNQQQKHLIKHNLLSPSSQGDSIVSSPTHFGISPFILPKGTHTHEGKVEYALQAKTTQMNLLRVLRSMTLPKAILLEGPPGVGKTSLLTTLAASMGHKIVRINLSEQTDMMDLLGMDLPVPGGSGGEFQWCDGIFLQALKAGDWVLLDELNLASQSVLEGLNAVLDHRAQVFIPELDATFNCPSTFRIFACQNPMSQGGGRKGLPASFLNRFTKVYLNSLQTEDLFFITSTLNPHISPSLMQRLITFNSRIHHETMVTRKIGRKGYPWEFNLRDVFKLCELMRKEGEVEECVRSKVGGSSSSPSSSHSQPNPGKYIDLIYLQRMRTQEDRNKVMKIYQEIFGEDAKSEGTDATTTVASTTDAPPPPSSSTSLIIEDYPAFNLTSSYVQVGSSFLPRRRDISSTSSNTAQQEQQPLLVLKQLLRPLAHLAKCLQYNFPTILLGASGTGKTNLVRLLSTLTHNPLHEILMTSGIDSSELLGCFEQVDLTRHKKGVMKKVGELVQLVAAKMLVGKDAALQVQQQDGDEMMTDNSTESSAKSAPLTSTKKTSKRGRDGTLTPTSSTAAAVAAMSVSSSPSPTPSVDAETQQQVSQLLHTWSLLDASYHHQPVKTSSPSTLSSSLLAQADEEESSQELSTAAFSIEQYTLLQSLLQTITSILPSLSSSSSTFTVPSYLSPSLLLSQSSHIQSLSSASQGKVIGNFEWIDGSLISALENGDWILLDNVNFCNPTVLDRLNPLLEIDGVLLVNECGLIDGQARIIKPHPNFRMILAMDPKYGEVSRAMRNRCLEICMVQGIGECVVSVPSAVVTKQVVAITTSSSAALPTTAVSPNTHDLLSIVNSLGISGHSIPQFLVSIHTTLARFASSAGSVGHAAQYSSALKSISVRNLKHWTILAAQQIQTGASAVSSGSDSSQSSSSGLFSTLWLTFKHSYNLSLTSTSSTSTVKDTFSEHLTKLFRSEYRKIVLQKDIGGETKKSVSSLLTPTLWPTMSHSLSTSSSTRAIAIQGSVLKYLSLLALGQSISSRDVSLLNTLREYAQSHIDSSNTLAFLPDAMWKFVFGLTKDVMSDAVKKEQDDAILTTKSVVTQSSLSGEAISTVEVTPTDQRLLLPVTSLTPAFALSQHSLHAHPTSVQLFKLACRSFIEFSTKQDYQHRIRWIQEELLNGKLFLEQHVKSETEGVKSTTSASSQFISTITLLRTEISSLLHTLTSLYSHPIITSYTTSASELIDQCGYDSEKIVLPLNPRMNEGVIDLIKTHTKGDKALINKLEILLSQSKLISLLISATYHSYHEQVVYDGISLLLSSPTSLSLLELSYACYTNLIASQRLHTIVQSASGGGVGSMNTEFILQLYPFWTAMRGFEKGLVQYGYEMSQTQGTDRSVMEKYQVALTKLVQDASYFWLTIHSTKNLLSSGGSSSSSATASSRIEAILSQIHIRWKVLSRCIKELVALVPGLSSAATATTATSSTSAFASSPSSTQSPLHTSYSHFHSYFLRLQSTLQGTAHSSTQLVGVKDTLWKYGGHPILPREKKMEMIEQELRELEMKIMYQPNAGSTTSMQDSSQQLGTLSSTVRSGTPAFFIVDTNFKHVLLDAYVNLKYLYLKGASDASDDQTEEDATSLASHRALLTTLSSLPTILQTKLSSYITQDRAQLDSMRFHIQIVSEGEESLEDLGFNVEELVKKEEEKRMKKSSGEMMEDEEEEDEASRPSAQFLSISADASSTTNTSTRFSDQTSHKKSFIMPLLLPIFDLAYMEWLEKNVLGLVQYVAFLAGDVRRVGTKMSGGGGGGGGKQSTPSSVDITQFHTLLTNLHSSLTTLLNILPSLLQFYTQRTSAISGLLDLQAMKIMELIAKSGKETIEEAEEKHGRDLSTFVANPSVFSSLLKTLHTAHFFTTLSHLPLIVQEIQYHYSRFHARFAAMNEGLLKSHLVHSSGASSRGSDTMDTSYFLLTPLKSLLVVDLISQSMNISLIHRHAKRIQLQMLGEFLTNQLGKEKKGGKKVGLITSGTVPLFSSSAHRSLLSCVTLLTNFYSIFTCFSPYYSNQGDYERVLSFVNTVVKAVMEVQSSSETSATFLSALPTEIQQALMKIQDPRFYSLVPSLVVPFFNSLLSHMSQLRSSTSSSNSVHILHLGHSTLYLSLLRYYLLLPVSPVDQNQKYFILLKDEMYFSTQNRMELEEKQWRESLITGKDSSYDITTLQHAFTHYHKSITSLHKKVTYRRNTPDVTKPFHLLFHELHRFSSTFLDLQKVTGRWMQRMMRDPKAEVKESENEQDEQKRLLEELSSFQTNSSEFILRIQSTFSEYPDFIVPLLTSLYSIKHGLSLMQYGWNERSSQYHRRQAVKKAVGQEADKNAIIYQTIRALVSFPFGAVGREEGEGEKQTTTSVSVDTTPGIISPLHHLTHTPILTQIDSLCRQAVNILREQSHSHRAAMRESATSNESSAGTDANEIIAQAAFKSRTSIYYSIRLHILSIVLSRILLFSRVSGRLTPDLLSILDQLFHAFITIYKSNLLRQEQRAAEEAELYKYKETKEDVLTEEEKDKIELQQLFPDYSAEFNDILGTDRDGVPNMDEEVEERERKQAAYAAAQAEAARAKQDSDDEYGILTLNPEHLMMIYNTFTQIFSIQKASLMTPAVTSSVTFTEQEENAYIQSYSSSYEIGATLLHALSMQGSLSNTSVIASPSQFEAELQSGHLFMICKCLHSLTFTAMGAAGAGGENEVNAIMESFLHEDTENAAVTINPDDGTADGARLAIHTDVLEEGIKIDGKTGTKRSADSISQSTASAKQAASKIDWSKFPDIYHESNIEEYRKLEKPLTLLMLRLRQLLNQYNNHPILLQLLQLSHRILNFSNDTPLMKLLTGLEYLLKKSEEWEKYAARHVSIKKELIDLGILVARWRKMELYTWPKALASKEQVFHSTALKGWFHLYALIHTNQDGVRNFFPDGTFPSGEDNEERIQEAFLQKLYEALDEFLTNSNLGELKTRMNILLAFYQQINLEVIEGFGVEKNQSNDGSSSQRMSLALRLRIQNLLLNLYQYYEQFLPHVDDMLKAKKAPIEKSLREQVRLAKWDLSNYWSLKESSEKSHRKLQKFAKDYEDVLRHGFAKLLTRENERDTKPDDDSVNFGRVGAEIAEARSQIEKLEKRIRKEQAKIKKKVEKKKKAAEVSGVEFQEDSAAVGAEEEEDFDLPSLAQSLAIVLPDAELYLSDKVVNDAWFKNVETVSTTTENQQDDVDMTAPAAPSSSSTPSVTSYQSRLPTFYHKMHVLLRKGLLSTDYTTSRQSSLLELEEFSIHLISRVQKLTASKDTKFAYKKNAYMDVMKTLKEMGLTHHMSVLKKLGGGSSNVTALTVDVHNKSSTQVYQEQTASIPTLFLQSPLTSIFLKSSTQLPVSKSEPYEFMRSLAKKCEAYLYRVWTGVKKMRLRSTNFHKDLNASEIQKSKGMAEHLFFIICNQREKVSQVAVEYHTARKWMEWMRELDVEVVDHEAQVGSDAIHNNTASATSPFTSSSPPSWSSRFWSHKHLLDSLFASTKYLQLLYTRIRDTVCTQDTQLVKGQVDEAAEKVRHVLLVLSQSKNEMDAKIARLFPNQQLAQTSAAITDAASSSSSTLSLHTAAESSLELNDAPNAQFLLANINKVLSVVTVRDESDDNTSTEEGGIIDLPYLATTSTFNELVVTLVKEKYEIMNQARLAVAPQVVTINATTSGDDSSSSLTTLSTSFTSTYHSLVSLLLLSVQTSYKQTKTLADTAAQRARVEAGTESENPNTPTSKFLVDEHQIADTSVSASHLEQINAKMHQLTLTLNQIKCVRQHTSSSDSSVATTTYNSYRISLHNLVPLLDQVLLLTERSLGGLLNLHRSYLKLSHILLSIMNKILSRGFCRKPDEPEAEDSGETEEKEGMGMGEGEGTKDVSNEITNEEQLLGTKNDDEEQKDESGEKPPPEKPDTDEGVEMDNDFDGDMHDVPDEEEKDDKDGDDDDKDKEELDREMGDLNDQQDVVDEKLWDQSDDDEDETPEEKQKKKEEEKYERDAPVDGAPEDDEIAAKEDGADDSKQPEPPKKDEKSKQPEKTEDEKMPDEPEKKPEEDNEGEEEEEPAGPINEDRDDKYEDKQGPDAMNDLPDDLALDDDEKDEKQDGEGEGDDDEKEENDDEKMDEDGETLDKEEEKKLDETDGAEAEDDGKGEDVGEEEKNELDENPDEPKPDEPQPEESAAAVEAPEAQGDQPEPEKGEEEDDDDAQEPDVERPDQHADPESKDTDQGAHRVAGGDQGHAGVDEQEEKEKEKKNPNSSQDDMDRSDDTQQAQEEQTLDQANSNDANEGTESEWQPQSAQSHPHQSDSSQQQEKRKKKREEKKQTPNPFKSLGDATKKWAERLKLLDESKEEDADQTQLENDDDDDEEEKDGDADPDSLDGTFENVKENEKADTQMLGPVEQKLDAEDVPKIKPQTEDEDTKMDEPQPEEEYNQPDEPNDNEKESNEKDDDDSKKKKDSKKRGGSQKLQPTRMADPIDDEEKMNENDDEEQKDESLFDPFHASTDEGDEELIESRIGAMDDLVAAKSQSAGIDPNDPAHQAWLQQIRDELDASLQAWDASSTSSAHYAHSQTIWNKFTELTAELSASLTESLRIILEPMIATKLKGDYKTGKRINIKKIIPYIASSFRKDKIWLKRTKPNKRHYQVMIAIDDSASMKSNRGGRLALEAMTVLCKALSALEVGELAIASFGNQVKLLHPFTRPFTDESGAYAVGQFQFTQQFTRWPDLLERTVALLDEAKSMGGSSSAAASEHHQLVFIISDARVQQDREIVARWTREALSKNQLLVLIIVESGELKDSILSTKTVTYPQGRMKIGEYLDDFPFPYYILLRDITTLPEIVADALRQWFELIRSTTAQ